MYCIHIITQEDIDTNGHAHRFDSADRRLSCRIHEEMLGRYEQSDLGRRVYLAPGGRIVLGGSHPNAPR